MNFFYRDKDLFNFSNYPKDSTFYDLTSMNEIDKMKDESEEKIISEFAGLKSKMYSITNADGKENKKGIGVNSVAVNNIEDKEYVDVLFGKKIIRHNMKRIQSKLHKIGTYNVCKISVLF